MKSKTWIARALPVAALLLYVVAATAGAFSGGLWAALGMGGGIVLFAAVCVADKKIPMPDADLTILVMVALLVMAALNFQSTWPDVSWHEWLKLLTIFVPLLLLSSPSISARIGHKEFSVILPVAIVAGGLALSFELYLKGPLLEALKDSSRLTQYNRGLSYLVILSFPAMAGLWFSKKRWLILPFLFLLLVPASFTESRASKLALVLGLPVMVVAHLWPVFARRALAVAVIVTLGWPFAAQKLFLTHYDWLAHIPDSWQARIEIWDYMSYRILERPFLGWGLGTSSSLPYFQPHGPLYVYMHKPAAHPHNVMTQLWVELGLPGLALGLAFAFLSLRKIARLDPRLSPFALGCWTACFSLALTAYNFWTDSLFAAFALTGVAFAMLENRLRRSRV